MYDEIISQSMIPSKSIVPVKKKKFDTASLKDKVGVQTIQQRFVVTPQSVKDTLCELDKESIFRFMLERAIRLQTEKRIDEYYVKQQQQKTQAVKKRFILAFVELRSNCSRPELAFQFIFLIVSIILCFLIPTLLCPISFIKSSITPMDGWELLRCCFFCDSWMRSSLFSIDEIIKVLNNHLVEISLEDLASAESSTVVAAIVNSVELDRLRYCSSIEISKCETLKAVWLQKKKDI